MSQPVLSYSSQVVPPGWARWLMRPIGWPFFTGMGLAALWMLWAFRLPEHYAVSRLGILMVALVPVIWFLRLVLRLVLFRVYRRPWRDFFSTLWRFGIPVGVAVLVYACLFYKVPEVWAWRLSEPSFRRYALKIRGAETAKTSPARTAFLYPGTWIGLYPCFQIEYWPRDHAVGFFISGCGDHGFAYCPGGPPSWPTWKGMREARFIPLEGDWYRMELDSSPDISYFTDDSSFSIPCDLFPKAWKASHVE